MEKTAVLFDVGAVLLELNYKNVYEEGAKLTGISVDEYKKLNAELELGVLNGDISYEEHQRRLRYLLGKPDMTRRELEDFVKKSWGGEITPVVDLKERVYFEANCPVNIFSNIDRFAYEYLSRTYPRMFQTFNPEAVPICSYTSGGVKPKPMMYQEAQLWACNAGCDKIILIEDKPAYIEPGIKNFGWSGIFFTPYVDPNEAIRHQQGQNQEAKPTSKLRIANSVQELEQALRDFGVRV